MIRPNPVTIQLRYLQALSDISSNQGSTIVFPLPMDLLKPLLDKADGGRAGARHAAALADGGEQRALGAPNGLHQASPSCPAPGTSRNLAP